MNDIAIRVENLSKLYRIGAKQESYQTLRDTLAGAAAAPFRRIRSTFQRSDVHTFERSNAFWALKDVSLEVKRGEVVGIIGRNGAGKSTLLKILSRITEPTGGYADIYGRVGSLLEVGTGFHPELTGRENIYLNGAILGMKREEIHRRFDQIVEFAEVEQFVDTPVKHYSSGMYLRLAFAVAAHLEPEILLVDEVLAVGDVQFQKKCLGKMGDVANEGRTVLFISHNMSQIRKLCDEGILLNQGLCVQRGPIDSVITQYELELANENRRSMIGITHSQPQNCFLGWEIVNSTSQHVIDNNGALQMRVHLHLSTPVLNGHHGLVLQNADGVNVCGWGASDLKLEPGRHAISYQLPNLPVKPGVYFWYASLWDGSTRIDVTHLLPELRVTTQNHSLLSDEWSGFLNIPCSIKFEGFSDNITRYV